MKYFKKKHLILNFKNSENINNIVQSQFAVYFCNSGILNYDEFKAIRFFLKKRLKFYSKRLFIRITPKLKNTTKSIGVRMGKGKGSLNEFYFKINKGQIFMEFGYRKNFKEYAESKKKKILDRLRKIIKLSSIKTKLKLNLLKEEKE